MATKKLRNLEHLAGMTPAELEREQPELFEAVREQMGARLNSLIDGHFEDSPDAVREVVKGFAPDDPLAAHIDRDVRRLIEESELKEDEKAGALQHLDRLEVPGSARSMLHRATPIGANPLFARELAASRSHRLGKMAKLGVTKVDSLLGSGVNLATLGDGDLGVLVDRKALDAREAEELGLDLSLYRLLDESPELVETVRSARIDGLPGRRVSTVGDLVALDTDKWSEVLDSADVEPPMGLSRNDHARLIERRVAAIFPTDTMVLKLEHQRQPLGGQLEMVEPLLGDGGSIVTPADELDFGGIPQRQRRRIRRAHAQLRTAVLNNPGLQLEGIIDDTTLPISERAATVDARIAANQAFLSNNTEVELLHLDLSAGSDDLDQIDFGGISAPDQPLVLGNLKAYQRMYSVAGNDALDAASLIESGYASSSQIASTNLNVFLANTNLDEPVATAYYERAVVAAAQTGLAAATIHDAIAGGLEWTNVGNVSPDIGDFFRDIEGFEELFGAQTFCDCEHCRSILSPAAYFADLMRFVEANILDQVFVGGDEDHVMSLRARRPDLWALELTCENTHTEIPLLVVITEILENYLANRTGFGGDIADRVDVADHVYRQRLADNVDSFSQPCVLPLKVLETYLGHFSRRRADLVQFVDTTPEIEEAAALGVSSAERGLIATPQTGSAFLERIYGTDFTLQGSVVRAFDSQVLVRATGLSRDALGEAIRTGFVTDLGSVSPTLRGAKRSAQSVQNDIERAHGLTFAALDRLHRIVRLSRATGWSFGQLDVVDRAVRSSGRAGDITSGLSDVAIVSALSARYSAATDVVASLMGDISDVAEGDTPGLLDRLFNAPYWLERDARWPSAGASYLHAAHAVDLTTPSDLATGRLLGGLGISDDDLIALIDFLSSELGAELEAAADVDRSFALTASNLGILYRHAVSLDWIGCSVAELAQMIELAETIPGATLDSLDDVVAVLSFADVVDASDLDLDDIWLAAGLADLGADVETDPAGLADRLIERVSTEGGLNFADTVFTAIAGITEDQSREIIAANAGVMIAADVASFFSLAVAFDPAVALTIPAGVVATNDDLLAAVLPHHGGSLLVGAAAAELSTTRDAARVLLDAAGIDLMQPGTAASATGNAPPDPLVAPLGLLVRFGRAIDLSTASDGLVALVCGQLDLVGIASLTGLSATSALRLAALAALDDEELELVSPLLTAYAPATGFDAAPADTLAQVLGLTAAAAMAMQATVRNLDNAVDALELLLEAAGLARQLGVAAEVFADAATNDYERLDAAAGAVVAAMRVAHPDDDEWREVVEPYEAEVLNAKRDGLVGYLIHSVHPEFESMVDLYHYFLLDPEVDGCFPTSRVVAAISSVQSYVHRVLMNLEQSEDVELTVSPELVPREEWDWRKNYRVWEANRKVFLWTENYLDPDVRDDKTGLFEDFESAILQNELDEQAILDAYATYMEGFEVLANLSIAGTYHDIDDDSRSDVLHVIGVTPGDPPTYYYRTAENILFGRHHDDRVTSWSSWQPMDVKIPVREASPVVHDGRLHVFWVEIVTSPQNEVREAGSKFVGYTHRLGIKYSTLRLDGRWTVPQSLSLYGTRPFAETDGIVDDPLIEPEELDDFLAAIRSMFGFGIFSTPTTSLSDSLRAMLTPRYDDEPHTTARDGYTLGTSEWTRIHPESTPSGIRITGAGYQMRAIADLFDKDTSGAPGNNRSGRTTWAKNVTPPSPALSRKGNGLYYGTPSIATFDDYAWAALVADEDRLDRVSARWSDALLDLTTDDLYKGKIANLGGAVVHPVNGSLVDAVIDDDGDLLLLQGSAVPGLSWVVQRIGTTLARSVARALFADGIDGLLATETQESLGEAGSPIQLTSSAVLNEIDADEIDFTGPFGVYYREIFFHMPFVIARVLQGQRNHAEAKRWYEYLFDPTSTETVDPDPGLSDEENAARRRDRNWRYTEFRGLGLPELRKILTHGQALATYREDPFNPHAIARLRLSAYQKSVVMAYVDNLIDWGDQLFARFQQDSINEAIGYYQTARDILGARPVQIGDCGIRSGSRSYEQLKPALEAGSEFLAELEHWSWIRPKWQPKTKLVLTVDSVVAATATWYATLTEEMQARGIRTVGTGHVGGRRASVEMVHNTNGTTTAYANFMAAHEPIEHVDDPLVNFALSEGRASSDRAGADERLRFDVPMAAARYVPGTTVAGFGDLKADSAIKGELVHTLDWKHRHDGLQGRKAGPRFVWSFIKQVSPAFCIPGNSELLEYWDRVEDRLYKIHNCLDINGQRRQLSLFAPEIDPRALIRAKAAGLSTDDVLDALTGSVPPLRFPVLLDRARQYAGVVQSFGSALQGALERKDGEELSQLRLTHQRNVLNQTTRMRLWEYDVAAKSVEAAEARQTVVANRLTRLEALRDTGLIAEEWVERVSHHIASGAHVVEATLGFLSGALHLIPQVGSPFAMKYGGMEAGSSAHRFAVGTRAVADAAAAVAGSAKLEASFSRRAEGWDHQIEQTRDELAQIEKEIAASRLRLDVAGRAVELHDLAVEQAEEIDEATRNKFSNLGMYTWQAATLQTVHRDAYNCALSLARMAERAFRFERDDQASTLLSGDYWSPAYSGLLAGSQLLVELEQLEKRYLETTPTDLEIDQTFSLFQMNPAALVELKQTGSTVFEVPEHFFDIHYPGHYRRRIKAVRLTIPCVAGPHANVAAALTLEDSLIRADADPAGALRYLPAVRAGGVATSTGQNDAGVFELTFGGQTYLPFEGAGAISRWRLTLPDPQGFPPFDYQSISDVLVRLSYTALTDGVLAAHRQQDNAALAGTLAFAFANGGLQRVVSLRQEHAGVFQRLVAAPTDSPVELEIGDRHFPWFVGGRELEISGLRIAAVAGAGVGSLRLSVDGHDTGGFGAAPDLGGLPAAAVAPLNGDDPRRIHTLIVADGGDVDGGAEGALDASALDDLLLVIDYLPGDRT